MQAIWLLAQDHPIEEVAELVVYTIVWTAFIAAGAGVRSGKHLTIELIKLVMRGRFSRPLARIIAVIGAVSGRALTVLGIGFVLSAEEF